MTITDLTQQELNSMCREILEIFKKYHAREGEAIGAMYLLIAEFYQGRLTQEPKRRQDLADLVQQQFEHMNNYLFGER